MSFDLVNDLMIVVMYTHALLPACYKQQEDKRDVT